MPDEEPTLDDKNLPRDKKNTLSARRYRLRKKTQMRELEEKVTELETEVTKKGSMVTQLQAENRTLKDQLESLKSLLGGALPKTNAAVRAYFVLFTFFLVLPTFFWYSNPYNATNPSSSPATIITANNNNNNAPSFDVPSPATFVADSSLQSADLNFNPAVGGRRGRVLLWCDCANPSAVVGELDQVEDHHPKSDDAVLMAPASFSLSSSPSPSSSSSLTVGESEKKEERVDIAILSLQGASLEESNKTAAVTEANATDVGWFEHGFEHNDLNLEPTSLPQVVQPTSA